MEIHEYLSLFDNVKQVGENQWSARCPAHDDRHNSLSIGVGDNGAILITCHAGCPSERINELKGLTFRDLFPRPSPSACRRSDKKKGADPM